MKAFGLEEKPLCRIGAKDLVRRPGDKKDGRRQPTDRVAARSGIRRWFGAWRAHAGRAGPGALEGWGERTVAGSETKGPGRGAFQGCGHGLLAKELPARRFRDEPGVEGWHTGALVATEPGV